MKSRNTARSYFEDQRRSDGNDSVGLRWVQVITNLEPDLFLAVTHLLVRLKVFNTTDSVRMTYIPLSQIATFLPAAVASADGKAAKPATCEENEDCYAHTILICTTGDSARTIADLRAAVEGVEPNLPLLQVPTIHDQVSQLISHDELISIPAEEGICENSWCRDSAAAPHPGICPAGVGRAGFLSPCPIGSRLHQ